MRGNSKGPGRPVLIRSVTKDLKAPRMEGYEHAPTAPSTRTNELNSGTASPPPSYGPAQSVGRGSTAGRKTQGFRRAQEEVPSKQSFWGNRRNNRLGREWASAINAEMESGGRTYGYSKPASPPPGLRIILRSLADIHARVLLDIVSIRGSGKAEGNTHLYSKPPSFFVRSRAPRVLLEMSSIRGAEGTRTPCNADMTRSAAKACARAPGDVVNRARRRRDPHAAAGNTGRPHTDAPPRADVGTRWHDAGCRQNKICYSQIREGTDQQWARGGHRCGPAQSGMCAVGRGAAANVIVIPRERTEREGDAPVLEGRKAPRVNDLGATSLSGVGDGQRDTAPDAYCDTRGKRWRTSWFRCERGLEEHEIRYEGRQRSASSASIDAAWDAVRWTPSSESISLMRHSSESSVHWMKRNAVRDKELHSQSPFSESVPAVTASQLSTADALAKQICLSSCIRSSETTIVQIVLSQLQSPPALLTAFCECRGNLKIIAASYC
ncbi:hypothetical protein DFH09DRAFT_1097069 [Mycena vulgaris]|nr:hypothetical protein DFH09DRAFT_1097069 [Mycena vulgaris]